VTPNCARSPPDHSRSTLRLTVQNLPSRSFDLVVAGGVRPDWQPLCMARRKDFER